MTLRHPFLYLGGTEQGLPAMSIESLLVLTDLIDATLAQAKTPLALGLMAVFTEFPFFRDGRLRSLRRRKAITVQIPRRGERGV